MAKEIPTVKAPEWLTQPVEGHAGLTWGRVIETLETGIESGSSYWASDFLVEGEPKRPDGLLQMEVPNPFNPTQMSTHYSYGAILELMDGRTVKIRDFEDDEWITGLDKDKLAKAVTIMAEKYKGHYADMLNENDDAWTGDTLMQLFAFGETIYA